MVTLPALPAENENPWYAKRQAFDLAVKTQIEGPLSQTPTAAPTADNTVRFLDQRGMALLTIVDTNTRPKFEGTFPVDGKITPGDGVRIVDFRGMTLYEFDSGSGGTGDYRETHLIGVWGQSNSLGWRSAPIPKYTNEPVPNLFMYPTRGTQSGQIVPGIDPLLANRTLDEVQADARGFAIAYARWYALQNPDIRVVVVPNGVGGTGFRYAGGTDMYRWAVELQDDVGVIPLYTEMVDRMATVAAMFEGTVRTVATLGQLGEADAVGLTTQAQYAADLAAIAVAFRADLPNATDSLFLVGQTVWEFRNERMEGTYAEIDAATLDVPNQIVRSGVALAPDGPGYARSTDDTHFTTHGAWKMYKAYVQAHEDALYNL